MTVWIVRNGEFGGWWEMMGCGFLGVGLCGGSGNLEKILLLFY